MHRKRRLSNFGRSSRLTALGSKGKWATHAHLYFVGAVLSSCRQQYPERRAPSDGCLDAKAQSVLLSDSVHQRQAQPGATLSAHDLGGKERFKNTRKNLRFNPRA